MVEIKNPNAKQYFAILIAIIILTDLVILLNIPFMRQILGFLCFTIIPGLLILHVLKLNKIEFLKKFVLSVGLSITFLMFTGLFVNSFYPLILSPLSLLPLLISFNIVLIIMAFIAYKRNKDDFDINDVLNFKLDLKDKLTSPLIFSVLFPFMAVFGTYLMNTQGNNIILLAMLFLIPAYVVAVVFLRDRIPDATYPVAVLMIGMTLLLMTGLRSNNLSAGAASGEYYFFQVALNNSHWDNSLITKLFSNVNACLSTTILAPVYKIFLELPGVYIYKLIYNLIGSIIPLSAYFLFKKYVSNHYAFISSFFFMAQYTFISMLGWVGFRQLIALLPFVLAIIIFFDTEIDKLSKKILFLIFILSTIVSHYATAYIFFLLLFAYWFLSNLDTIRPKIIGFLPKDITALTIVLFFALIFFWYGQITTTPFNEATHFIKDNLMNLAHLSLEGIRSEPIFMGSKAEKIPERINIIVHDITFIFIALGVLGLIKNRKNTKFDEGYLLMMILCLGLLTLLVGISSVFIGYGPDRAYQQLLVFLAPAFVIGGETISKLISRFKPKLNLSLVFIMIVLIAQFFSATYMVYQICGVHHSEFLNSDGIRHDWYYVYDVDVAGANWVYIHTDDERLRVWVDVMGAKIYSQFGIEPIRIFNPNVEIKEGYIYMRTVNVINEKIYLHYGPGEDLSNCTYLFLGRNKIYSNGGSEIYKCRR